MALAAARRHDTWLWARDPAHAASMAASRLNERYLPGLPLPPALRLGSDLVAALQHAQGGLLVLAVPMAGLRGLLQQLPAGRAAVWLCKGFEAGTGLLGHEVARALAPGPGAAPGPSGILSGPSFALEVARGQPTALVVAADDEALAEQAVAAFHGDSLRVYRSDDIVGVEVGGAVKNVMAIAVGILDGMPQQPQAWALSPALNARAALITRGLAEMTRLGLALGARTDTFMGLSGLGDLVLTATGDLSRNRRVGLQLAAGRPLGQILAELGHVAEGVHSAVQVLARARSLGVEMPITEAVVDVLEGRLQPAQALARLMARDARSEY
jgi:glycerol-3-phosphate dehydrogenase (NAD(P)+)